MRWLKRLGLGLAAAVVLILGIGLLLPRSWSVERTVSIRATPDQILPFLDSPAMWPTWSAWSRQKYPDMKLTFEGPARGEGATWIWSGASSGEGSLTITGSEREGITYHLQFEDFPPIDGAMHLRADGESTRVIWVMEGVVPSDPVSAWMSLFMSGMMGADLDEGLAGLKAKVEEHVSFTQPTAQPADL